MTFLPNGVQIAFEGDDDEAQGQISLRMDQRRRW